MAGFIAQTERLDVYRYLVMAIVAKGDPALLELLLAAARVEQEPDKAAILVEGLTLLRASKPVAEALARLRKRL